MFNGIQIKVVESGYELYDSLTDSTYVVDDGNVVNEGNRILYMTQHDCDLLKEKIDEQTSEKP